MARTEGAARATPLQGDAEADVVVIGGGFAGVSAARELDRSGVSVILLEARDRLGGRTLNADIGGGVVGSLGAQAASSHHSHMLELAREVGAETFPLPYKGKGVYVQDDQRMEVDIPDPSRPQPPWEQLFATLRQWDKMAQEIDPDRPWEAPHAWEWDAQTAITWIAGNIKDPFTQAALAGMVRAANAPPQKTSLLSMLYYGRANEVGWAADHTFLRGWQRCSQGWQTVAERVGDRLGRGRKVYTSSRVREVRQDETGVTVRGDGFRVSAKRAIVAMPPHLMGRLDYDPPLPAARQALSQRVPLEGGYQALAVYNEPFWFKDGLTGHTVSPTLPIPGTLDDSPKDHSCGILLCLTNQLDDERLRTATPEESRELHLLSLEKYFGPKARKPEAFYFKDWDTDPFSGGCIPHFTTGALTSCGMALRQPHGRVHFASTEQSSRYWVHMNGAVHSGKETAKQVLDRL